MIIVTTTLVSTVESMLRVVHAVDVLNNLLVAAPLIDNVSVTDADMLADEYMRDLVPIKSPLEFTLPAS